MGIIIKYLLKNIREKKLRSFLVVFSITIASGLFFASTALSTTIEDLYMERIRKYYGSSDIAMRPDWRSGGSYLRPDFNEESLPLVEASYGIMWSNAKVVSAGNEEIDLSVFGTELKELLPLNKLVIPDDYDIDNFTGHKVIMSSVLAEEIGVRQGENIKLSIWERDFRFRVDLVTRPTGPLAVDPWNKIILMPIDFLWGLTGAWGRYSDYYVKSRDGTDPEHLIEIIKKSNPRAFVEQTMPEAELKSFSSNMTIPFRLMLVLVLFTSVFIIFTSFQVITRERLPVIGTFRSIGATRASTSWIFLGESIAYGVLGGFFGLIIGYAALYGMTYFAVDEWIRGNSLQVSFKISQMVMAFFAAILISFFSSLVPIITVSRISPKDVILGNIRHKGVKKRVRLILGAIFLLCGFLGTELFSGEIAMVTGILSMVFMVLGVIQLAPFLAAFFSFLFQYTHAFLFGNIGVLAAKNLKDNAAALHNISLLAIGISSLLMINSISYSLNKELNNLYSRADFEMMAWIWPMNKSLPGRIRNVEGVKDIAWTYQKRNVSIAQSNERINSLQGVDPYRYDDFWDYDYSGGDTTLELLDKGRFIILTRHLQKTLGYNAGDVISLDFGGRIRDYTIIGFFSTIDYNGNMALVSERQLKMDAGVDRYDILMIKTEDDPAAVIERLGEKFKRVRPWMETMEDMEIRNIESNGQMFLVLKAFSVMAMLIGAIGIVNNFLLGFLDRRKSLALLQSVGMSRRQMIFMIFIESFSEGLIGAVAGMISAVLMLYVVPHILLSMMNTNLPIYLSLGIFLSFSGAGVLITLISSTGPALKANKMNTLEALKYE